MIDPDLQAYLDGKFKGFDARLSVVERETNHIHKHMLTGEAAQNIFRLEVVKTNTRTRLAVAVIAAIALLGTGAQNALANHDAMAMQMRCEQGAAKAVTKADERYVLERHAIADETARRVLLLRDQQIDTLKGTP